MSPSTCPMNVKRRERAPLGHIINAGSTYYVPSPNMGRRNAISSSLGKAKTGTDVFVERNENRRHLTWEDVADEAERLLAKSRANRDATQESHDAREQEDEQEVKGHERDPYNEVILGFLFRNSRVRQIKDEIN